MSTLPDRLHAGDLTPATSGSAALAVEPGAVRSVVLHQGGGLRLEVPVSISDPTLYKEIAGQDVLGRKLLDAIDRLQGIVGSNRELFFCSTPRLLAAARQFLGVCDELRTWMVDLASYESAIPQLAEARDDVRAFFLRRVGKVIDQVEELSRELGSEDHGTRGRREVQDGLRKRLAKDSGMVRTELQKIFAHLLAHDPRNLYRCGGALSQRDILFRQFQDDVEITEQLYLTVSRLDRYLRGAIVPSDLLQMIADRIDLEGSVSCLFDPDYSLFLNALVEEVVEILLPELEEALTLSGIWYDDFENVERKSKALSELCAAFKAVYNDRYSLRLALWDHIESGRGGEVPASALELFDSFRHSEFANQIRGIDQVLVDLEGAVLQWEKGVARRAFALEEWQEAEPLKRRGRR